MLDSSLTGDPRRRSRLAWLLTLYAVIGLLILAIVAAGMTLATVRARDTLRQLDVQRDSFVRLLESTSRSLDSADDSAEQVTSTLGDASDSIARAASLARALATAAGGVVQASGLEIFGQRPLVALGEPFAAAAQEANALADSLDLTVTSLSGSASGVEDLSSDLAAVAEELDQIRQTVAGVDLESGPALEVALAVGLLLLAWLAAPALAALWLARRLRRTAVRYPAREDDRARRD